MQEATERLEGPRLQELKDLKDSMMQQLSRAAGRPEGAGGYIYIYIYALMYSYELCREYHIPHGAL